MLRQAGGFGLVLVRFRFGLVLVSFWFWFGFDLQQHGAILPDRAAITCLELNKRIQPLPYITISDFKRVIGIWTFPRLGGTRRKSGVLSGKWVSGWCFVGKMGIQAGVFPCF